MSQAMDKLIAKLKDLELEEVKLKNARNKLFAKLKEVDQQLDQISTKRSLSLKELEMIYLSDQNGSPDSSDTEFQSLCSENSLYPKSSDLDSDDFTQKRKDRSDSTNSDVEIKKVKSGSDIISERITCVDEVNQLDEQVLKECFDEIACDAINDIKDKRSSLAFSDELEKLSSDPLFESLVKDVEKENSQQSPNSSLRRSLSTDGNFKENVPPSSRVRRTSSNRFRFDQQNNSSSATRMASNYKSNANVISQSNAVPFKHVLRGKKLLSSLLTEKQTIDEKHEKSFTEKVEITSKDFKQNFSFWEKKTTECVLENKRNSKCETKVVSI